MKACVPTVGLWEPVHLSNQSLLADGSWKVSVSDEHPTLTGPIVLAISVQINYVIPCDLAYTVWCLKILFRTDKHT